MADDRAEEEAARDRVVVGEEVDPILVAAEEEERDPTSVVGAAEPDRTSVVVVVAGPTSGAGAEQDRISVEEVEALDQTSEEALVRILVAVPSRGAVDVQTLEGVPELAGVLDQILGLESQAVPHVPTSAERAVDHVQTSETCPITVRLSAIQSAVDRRVLTSVVGMPASVIAHKSAAEIVLQSYQGESPRALVREVEVSN